MVHGNSMAPGSAWFMGHGAWFMGTAWSHAGSGILEPEHQVQVYMHVESPLVAWKMDAAQPH